jgi:hypothetical protein
VRRSVVLPSSSPVTVSRRSTGMPSARLADSRRMRRSPPEHRSSPAFKAVMAASQSTVAIGVSPSLMLVPCSMKWLMKSSRRRNAPLAMSRGDAGFEWVEADGAVPEGGG